MRGVTKSYEETHKTINNKLYKQCSKCEEWFPCNEEYFYKNKLNKNDGLFPYCKQCAIEKTLTERDPLRTYELNKIHRHTNEKVKAARKRSNKKRVENGKFKEWQINNPERMKGYRDYRIMNKTHTINDEEWESCKNYFNYRCAYCGLAIEEHFIVFKGKKKLGDFHRDHVDHNGVNYLSNCVPSCKKCNVQKYNFDLNDWYNEKNKSFTYERLNKIVKWLEEDYKIYIKGEVK